jgi:D-alanine-D-alanine ligase
MVFPGFMRIAVLFTQRTEMSDSYHEDWEGRDTNDDAESVISALKELGHEVKIYYVDLDLFEKLRKDRKEIDMAFNLCDDGFFSDPLLEPHLPSMLDILGINYTGCDYLSLALCLNKARAKKILAYHDIPTPKFQVFRRGDEKIRKLLKYPLMVKPVHEDASIGIKDESVVRNESELFARVKHVIKEYNQPALVEEYIEGREFNVGILGEKEILPVAEILFDGLPFGKPRIINYAAKWKQNSVDYQKTNRSCPASIDVHLEKKLKSLAVSASRLMLCRDYCRVDFRVDKEEDAFVLEVNPNPDISEDAGLCAMAKANGYSYKDLIERIVKSASQRKNDNKE